MEYVYLRRKNEQQLSANRPAMEHEYTLYIVL